MEGSVGGVQGSPGAQAAKCPAWSCRASCIFTTVATATICVVLSVTTLPVARTIGRAPGADMRPPTLHRPAAVDSERRPDPGVPGLYVEQGSGAPVHAELLAAAEGRRLQADGKERMQMLQGVLHHDPKHRTLPDYSANATLTALQRQWARPLLAKRAHSARRLIFLAGLEGSGHHLWVALFKACGATGRCTSDADLARQLWSNGATAGLWSFETNLYKPRKAKRWEYTHPDKHWYNGFKQKEQEVRKSLHRVSQSSAPGLVLANNFVDTVRVRFKLGMMSYPNFPEPMKIFKTPDVRLLAELAEDEGVDFRVLFLHRSAAELLKSTTERQFGGWDSEAVILEHNAQALRAQLQLLDPAFVLCVDYDRMPELPTGFEAFLGSPGLRRLFAEQLARFSFRKKMAKVFHTKRGHNASLGPEQSVGVHFLQSAVEDVYRAARCGAEA